MWYEIASLALLFGACSVLAVLEYVNATLATKLIVVALFLLMVFLPLVFSAGIGASATWR